MTAHSKAKRIIPTRKSASNEKRVPRWELTHDMIEIHWVKDVYGKVYADKVKICGCLFFAAVYGDPCRRHRKVKRK